MMAGPKAAAVLETAAGLLLPALELLRGWDSVCPVAEFALLKQFRCVSSDDPMLVCVRYRSARSGYELCGFATGYELYEFAFCCFRSRPPFEAFFFLTLAI